MNEPTTPDNPYYPRRSGRTYRMLIEALGCIFRAKRILIIGATHNQIWYLRTMFQDIMPPGIHRKDGKQVVEFIGGAKVIFMSKDEYDDKKHIIQIGLMDRPLIFMDHFCYENS